MLGFEGFNETKWKHFDDILMGLVDGVGVDHMDAPVRTYRVLLQHLLSNYPIQSVQSPISFHPLLVSCYELKS